MDTNIKRAREVLDALPRCKAKSRQTGQPCKLPGTGNGGRCRFHGGRAGRKPTHGRYTKAYKMKLEWSTFLLAMVHALEGGKKTHFRFRASPERIAHLTQNWRSYSAQFK